MNMNYKKSLKLVTLLATALIIATASAQIYSYMYIQGSGTITTGGLEWALGSSAPGTAAIQGYTVTGLNLSIPVNTFKNFTDCLEIVNNDLTSHTFSVETNVMGGSPSEFTTFNLILYNSTSGYGSYATIDLKTQGAIASNLHISGSATMFIRFEVDPVLDATSGYMYFTVRLTYE
jgi:hypothetical protein